QLSASPLPIAAVRKFLPTKLMAPRVESLLSSIQEGEVIIKKAGIDATLAQMRRWAVTGIGEGVWLAAEVRNLGMKLNRDGALPLSLVQGQITLDNNLITLTDSNGSYGNSRLNKIAGTYAVHGGALNLQARGDLDLAEVREQLVLGVFPIETKMIGDIQELNGRARAELSLQRLKESPPQITGTLALDNVQLRRGDFLLSQMRGDINFTGTEIKADKISATISESPIQIGLVVRDYASQEGVFDISVDSTGMKSGIITQLLLSSGSANDPGVVRGSLRYHGSLTNKDKRSFTGNLDLVDVQFATQPLLQPIRALNGNIKFDESGIDFQSIKGVLVGFPSAVNARWRYAERPQLVFDFTAPSLDLTYLLSQVDAESSEFYANLQARGRIAIANGKIKAIDFGDLKSDVTIDRRVWRLSNLTARAAGGTVQAKASIQDRPDTLSIQADSQIRGVPIQSFLRWFDMTTTEMSGTVNLTGNLETAGNDDAERKRNLNGAFNLKIEEGIIHRMRILVQILNLLDLSRWFTLQLPDLTKDGIRFRSIAADFKVNKGVYFTQNLVVDSDDLRMTGTGRIDVPKDDIDFIIAVRPFAGIDAVINNIPLLGRGIAAIKNSFLVASFNIKGPIEEPTITPAPLGTLSEWFWGVLGIPKNAIGLGDNQKREDSKAAPR
ncbi:MAG TPA: AsmA-like C-terminal domain-containing protein, partial [Candidatus Binatia bacterium]|nr:AsmA-like C-terminal domain-containing protein [Candidatus Binatia bacterium]